MLSAQELKLCSCRLAVVAAADFEALKGHRIEGQQRGPREDPVGKSHGSFARCVHTVLHSSAAPSLLVQSGSMTRELYD